MSIKTDSIYVVGRFNNTTTHLSMHIQCGLAFWQEICALNRLTGHVLCQCMTIFKPRNYIIALYDMSCENYVNNMVCYARKSFQRLSLL